VSKRGQDRLVEIVLVEDYSDDVPATLDALKKANIANPVRVLCESTVLDFLHRTGSFSNEPPLPLSTLILLSLQLDRASGLDLLRRIKSDARTSALPVVMLTSSQNERGVMQSYKLGANACIVKPIDFHKFAEAVAELRLRWLLTSADGNHS
jgi:two-component system, response regulator